MILNHLNCTQILVIFEYTIITINRTQMFSKANPSLKYAFFSFNFNSAFKADKMNSKQIIKNAKSSVIRDPYQCVLAQMQCHERHRPLSFIQNVVPWEAQTGVFRLKIQCHGRPIPVCLCSQRSAMQCHSRPISVCFDSNVVS